MKIIVETAGQHTALDRVNEVTPEVVAALFAEMNADEQAVFFNYLGVVASPWIAMQLEYVTQERGLTLAGRRIMQCIGDYSHIGLLRHIMQDTKEKRK